MAIMGEDEIAAVARLIRGGRLSRYSWQGSQKGECELFEEELAAAFGTAHALLLSSGTNALISALVGAGVGPGDEVIVPAYTFIATPGAVLACGAVPVVANIDRTFSLDPDDVSRRITPKTKAIIPVHMNGRAAPMDRLTAIAKEKGILLIEDACQAIGGSFRGRKLGTFGEAGCFSFNNYKILSCGEGGALITNRPKIFERAFINHDMGVNFREYLDPLHEPIFIGQSMRASEISGAILRVQLKRLAAIISELKNRQSMYLSRLAKGKTYKINPPHCVEGDCGTSVLLDFESSEQCLRAEQIVSKVGLHCSQIAKFYRHIVSSWEPILAKRVGHHPHFNPLASGELSGIDLASLAPSLERFEKSLLLFVPIEKSKEENEALAEEVFQSLEANL